MSPLLASYDASHEPLASQTTAVDTTVSHPFEKVLATRVPSSWLRSDATCFEGHMMEYLLIPASKPSLSRQHIYVANDPDSRDFLHVDPGLAYFKAFPHGKAPWRLWNRNSALEQFLTAPRYAPSDALLLSPGTLQPELPRVFRSQKLFSYSDENGNLGAVSERCNADGECTRFALRMPREAATAASQGKSNREVSRRAALGGQQTLADRLASTLQRGFGGFSSYDEFRDAARHTIDRFGEWLSGSTPEHGNSGIVEPQGAQIGSGELEAGGDDYLNEILGPPDFDYRAGPGGIPRGVFKRETLDDFGLGKETGVGDTLAGQQSQRVYSTVAMEESYTTCTNGHCRTETRRFVPPADKLSAEHPR